LTATPTPPERAGARGTRPPWSLRRALPRLLLTGACVALLLVLLDARALFERIHAFVVGSPGAFALAVGAFLLLHLVSAMKWRLFLALAGARVSAVAAARCHGLGLFANLCLPSVIGGDLLRTALAMEAARERKEAVLFGGVVDRFVDLVALGALVSLGALLVPGATASLGEATPGARALLGVFFLGLLAVAVGLAVALRRPLRRGPGRSGPRRWVRIRLRLVRAWRTSRSRPLPALLGVALSFGLQASFCLVNVWIGARMGLELDWRVWFFVWPLAKIAGMVPVSLGGIGVREVAFAGFAAPFGVASELAVAQSFVWEACLVTGGLVAGATALLVPRPGRSG